MTKRDLVSLFIKMVAIYAVARSVPSLISVGTSLMSLRSFGSPENFLIVGMSIVAIAAFTVLLLYAILKSERISAWFVADDGTAFALSSLTSRDIQAMAFSWLGLSFAISGVLGTVYDVAYLVRIKSMIGAEEVKLANVQHLPARLISNLLETVIGAFLFLYPKGLVKLWHSINGTSKHGAQGTPAGAGAPEA